MHVAAHAGQAMQVELLLVHGGNPTALDLLGHTPEECARIAGHHQLADRLIECQYELTDKLSLFVSGRKPMHSIGEHFLVPPGVRYVGVVCSVVGVVWISVYVCGIIIIIFLLV